MLKRKIHSLIPGILLTLATASAHVVVLPRTAAAGATVHYTMRVPTEKNVATVRLEAEFPSAAEITSVEEKDGWKIELKKDPSGKIIGATWSGSSIAPHDIAEFGISARNPNQETDLVWKVVQVYEDGNRSEWTGPKGSRTPTSVTHLQPQ